MGSPNRSRRVRVERGIYRQPNGNSAYLSRGLRSLTASGGALFIYGHSLADNDDHILRCITEGKANATYVGLYGDPDSEANTTIRRRAEALAAARPERKPLVVAFYDAASADLWGHASQDDDGR